MSELSNSVEAYVERELQGLVEALREGATSFELDFAVVKLESPPDSTLCLRCSRRGQEGHELELVVRLRSLDADAVQERVDVIAGIAGADGALALRLQGEVLGDRTPEAALSPVIEVLAWVFADVVRRWGRDPASAPPISAWDISWIMLAVELTSLCETTGAHNAYVMDAWSNCWCAAHSYEDCPSESLLELCAEALGRLPKPLQRGGKLDAVIDWASGHAYFRSYAGVYILALRFSGPFDHGEVHAAVSLALPRIEELTLALPPPGGPGTDSDASALRG